MSDEHARRLDDIEKRLADSSLVSLTLACARMQRQLEDIEKRLARLERTAEKPEVLYGRAAHDMVYRESHGSQFCPCGRDVCRAPDCPSHKHDPLGR